MRARGRSPAKKRPPPGKEVVREWFDSAVNPLLRELRREQELLARENWTWRFGLGQPSLESIRRTVLYVFSPDNFEQFLGRYPDMRASVNARDKKVEQLREGCKRFHDALKLDDSFRDLYHKTTSNAALSTLGLNLSSLFGAYSREHHRDVLAEYVVNNIRFLPDYYAPAPYWNLHKDEFLAIRERPGVHDSYRATAKAGQALRRTNERLIKLLKTTRQHLSEELDVPIEVARPIGNQAGVEMTAYPSAY